MSSGLPGLLRVEELDVSVKVISERSTVRLTVERDATVTARVPPHVDEETLVRVVREKSQWLYERLAAREEEVAARPQKQYVSGEGFRYLGRSYRLKIVQGGPEMVRLVRGRLLLRSDRLPEAAPRIVDWYRQAGDRWLPRRISGWAPMMGLPVPPLKVRPLGFRWGSCTGGGTVNIHWASMQLPVDLVDYVLVHELAHLLHRHHTPEFWRLVELTMPGSSARRERLRVAGAELWLP